MLHGVQHVLYSPVAQSAGPDKDYFLESFYMASLDESCSPPYASRRSQTRIMQPILRHALAQMEHDNSEHYEKRYSLGRLLKPNP